MNFLLLALLQWLTPALAQAPSGIIFSPRHEIVDFDSKAASASAKPLKRDLLGLSIE